MLQANFESTFLKEKASTRRWMATLLLSDRLCNILSESVPLVAVFVHQRLQLLPSQRPVHCTLPRKRQSNAEVGEHRYSDTLIIRFGKCLYHGKA